MFSLQGTAPEFPRSHLKRFHEDEEDAVEIGAGCSVGFTEHRNKRFHALPLRTSPKARRWTPAMNFPSAPPFDPSQVSANSTTPSDSDSEEAAAAALRQQQQQGGYAQQWPTGHGNGVAPSEQLSMPVLGQAVDMDMDMTMGYAEPTPQRPQPNSPGYLAPGAFHPEATAPNIMGRMPTPIQPSFAAQVRGNNWSGAAGNIMQTSPSPGPYGSHADPATYGSNGPLPISGDRSVPRSLSHSALTDWSMVQNRSLPSPISENGGEDLGSPSMVLDGMALRSNSVDNSHLLLQRSHSAISLPALPESGLGVLATGFDASSGLSEKGATSAMDTDPPSTPSPKKGHTRSRHTLNSWTVQPGMKKSFSIGYRADCEKCRNKVPGHFNHIIVS